MVPCWYYDRADRVAALADRARVAMNEALLLLRRALASGSDPGEVAGRDARFRHRRKRYLRLAKMAAHGGVMPTPGRRGRKPRVAMAV